MLSTVQELLTRYMIDGDTSMKLPYLNLDRLVEASAALNKEYPIATNVRNHGDSGS